MLILCEKMVCKKINTESTTQNTPTISQTFAIIILFIYITIIIYVKFYFLSYINIVIFTTFIKNSHYIYMSYHFFGIFAQKYEKKQKRSKEIASFEVEYRFFGLLFDFLKPIFWAVRYILLTT